MRPERDQLRDMQKAQQHMKSRQRSARPFFNGWMIWAGGILLLICCTAGVAAVMDRDFVTLGTLCGVIVLVFAVRSYQYVIQKR